MASVVGLLEERELAARQRVESLREAAERILAELAAAEADWERWVIARERVDQVLSAPRGQEMPAVPGVREAITRSGNRVGLQPHPH